MHVPGPGHTLTLVSCDPAACKNDGIVPALSHCGNAGSLAVRHPGSSQNTCIITSTTTPYTPEMAFALILASEH